jgi:hypothetical protein
MLLPSVLVTIFSLSALISGKQFPMSSGVIGGVPSPDVHDCKSPKETLSNIGLTRTVGELRVVENSGICG